PRYDSTFPKKRMLGVKSVGWVEAEIDEWLTRRSKLI
ncbi:TPA: AlpA family phage regulatory protein, partial [Escherichia coli]